MAFIRCGGGTATLKATTLWTNPSPSSSFANQTISLSSTGIYDYIQITWRWSTSDSTEFKSIFAKNQYGGSKRLAIGGAPDTSTTARYRFWTQASSYSEMGWSNSVQHTSSSQTTSGAYVIPTKIEGLKLQTI